MLRRAGLPTALLVSALLLSACGGDGGDVAFPASTATGPSVVVPRLAGLDPDVAAPQVERLGLQWHPAFPGSSGNPAIQSGCYEVYNQAPAAGARVPGGSTVSVTVGVCHRAIPRGELVARRHHHGQSAH